MKCADGRRRQAGQLALILSAALALSACPMPMPTMPPARLTYPSIVLPAPSLAARVGPPNIYPNPLMTPGTLNANITQDTIGATICNPNWHGINPWTHKDEQGAASIRPPASYTTSLKKAQMAANRLPGSPTDYEEDHLISLELGGNPVDFENLWPEAYRVPGPKEKDQVENWLHDQVCAGAMTLRGAQDAIRIDWYAVYTRMPH
jgi:hypothetical protein